MEKFFTVEKDSNFYNQYFKWVNDSDKINDLFKEFANKHGIESKEYYQYTNTLSIILTEKDKEKFGKMLLKDGSAFKKSSELSKEWVNICKENNLETPYKPSVLWDTKIDIGTYSYSQRLFHIGDILYGSINNRCDLDFGLESPLVEIKGSDFYKVIEDYEKAGKDK